MRALGFSPAFHYEDPQGNTVWEWHLGDFNHPDVQAKIKHAVELCRKAGKPFGTVGPNPEVVIRYLEYGFTWVAINSDIGMMVGRATEWLGKVKSGAPGAAKA